jgi:hypothetical protein
MMLVSDPSNAVTYRDPQTTTSTYLSFPPVDRLSMLSTSSSTFLPPPPADFRCLDTTAASKQRNDDGSNSATAYQLHTDVGWYSVSAWNATAAATGGASDARATGNCNGFQHPTFSSFDRRQQQQQQQQQHLREADTVPSATALPPQLSVVRVGTMAHSTSTGSRKSVRFADETDFD